MIAPIILLCISVLFIFAFLIIRIIEKTEALKTIEHEQLNQKLKFSKSIDYENGLEINDEQ
jgi:hypothetical protein